MQPVLEKAYAVLVAAAVALGVVIGLLFAVGVAAGGAAGAQISAVASEIAAWAVRLAGVAVAAGMAAVYVSRKHTLTAGRGGSGGEG
ncbi:hypothetical protein [Nocardiopsis coralliicola]